VKSFGQFLSEAVKTAASAEAKLKGLVGDGHGGWYDKKGKFQAKTVKGKLKYVGAGGSADDEAPKQGGPAKIDKPKKPAAAAPAPAPTKSAPQQQQGVEASGEVFGTSDIQQQTAELMGEPTSEGVVVVFGRFNPPTVGHQKLIDAAGTEASRSGFDLRIYPSRSVDPKKNPLQPGAKIEYMKKMFPDYEEDIRDDANAKTIFDVLVACGNLGYKAVTIVVGQDRLAEFQSLAQKYNGDIYEFEEINVVSAGDRDADAEGIEGMSASKLRADAGNDDFKSFAKGIPNIGNMEKKSLFNLLQKSMGVKKKEVKKVAKEDLWQIAPKLDPFGLRVAYLNEDIFKIGSLVENVNTGLTGRITRRGANHVIVQTPESMMFKSWLKDLCEAYDVATDDYRDYVQKMTPGQPVKKFNGEPRINQITKGSFWDGKPKRKPEDPASGPGIKYNK
jgi:hypothetical protein